MKLIFAFSFIIFLSSFFGFSSRDEQKVGVERVVTHFREVSVRFAESAAELESVINLIDNNRPETINNARQALRKSRLEYKKIEFFLSYFFPQAALAYNSPAKFEVEVPDMEYREPVGFQVIESLLYEPDVQSNKAAILQQCEVIVTSADDLTSLLYQFTTTDTQILESVRLEVIRVMTLNISGFDAPLLKTGVEESIASLTSVQHCLEPYKSFGASFDSVSFFLQQSLNLLKNGGDFDHFDRLAFLTGGALPLHRHVSDFIAKVAADGITPGSRKETENFFAGHVTGLPSFTDGDHDELIHLGRKLFSEKMLSGNAVVSCETCHQPSKHFTDGLPKSIAFNQHSTVTRNAPSLLYARYQKLQFWDARALTIEDQVMEVIKSPVEMNGNYDTIINLLRSSPAYQALFRRAFRTDVADVISMRNVASALAAFIRRLNPMNSAFDRYVNGDKQTLSKDQVAGFNLFMGKAQCGTCHFSPFFNGLLPPYFDITEVEVLGVPASADFEKPLPDTDSGRYHIYPTPYFNGAFKTPTVRNAAVTAPYMHNGALQTLEQVVDFYNKGGGMGIHLPVTAQTLSAQPLDLDDREVKQIVSFLESLTDSLQTIHLPLKAD